MFYTGIETCRNFMGQDGKPPSHSTGIMRLMKLRQLVWVLVYPFVSFPLHIASVICIFRGVSPRNSIFSDFTVGEAMSIYGILATMFCAPGCIITFIQVFGSSSFWDICGWQLPVWIVVGPTALYFYKAKFFVYLKNMRKIPWALIGRQLFPLLYPFIWAKDGQVFFIRQFLAFVDFCVLDKEDRDLKKSRVTIGTAYKPVKADSLKPEEVCVISVI